MQFGGLDLSQLLGGQVAAQSPHGTPNIKANQNPMQNSWNADGSFQLGFPPNAPSSPVGPPPQGFTPPAQPSQPSGPAPTPGPAPTAPPSNYTPVQPVGPSAGEQYLIDNPGVRSYYENSPESFRRVGNDWERAARQHYDLFGRDEGRAWGEPTPPVPTPSPASTPPPTFVAPPTPQPSPVSAQIPSINPTAINNFLRLQPSQNPFMRGLYK